MPESSPVTKASTPALSIRALVVLAIVASGVYAIDQISKYLIVANMTEREQIPVIGELLQFFFIKNSGAAFSLGEGMTWIFSIVATGVAVFIVVFARRIRSTAWAVLFGLLLGGNLGNLTDRLFREPSFGQGHVIDFLQLYAFPAIFNIADVAIVSSMGLFILLTIRGIGLDGQRPAPASTAAVDGTADEAGPTSSDDHRGNSAATDTPK
ncbi:MAG TPA: signal peptidase II [Glaciihabitans sp.]|nr:signal peptidase II [Glaciihabitans sp.]